MENRRHIGQEVAGVQPEVQHQSQLPAEGVIMQAPTAEHTPHLEASAYAMDQILGAINTNPGMHENALATGALQVKKQ